MNKEYLKQIITEEMNNQTNEDSDILKLCQFYVGIANKANSILSKYAKEADLQAIGRRFEHHGAVMSALSNLIYNLGNNNIDEIKNDLISLRDISNSVYSKLPIDKSKYETNKE